MPIHAYAAYGAKQKLKPFSYEPKTLGPWDIEIKVSHCGICHSDIHLIDNDWGFSSYPLVPGHEIIGTVSAIGKNVNHLKPGDRAGIGWQAASCMECEWCKNGDENLCGQSRGVCVGNYGGFGERVFADARFAFKIPDGLDSECTAPLLCGGITVYSPLRRYGISSKTKVGVIGIGGLGHFALQFARGFGAKVTALSTSPEKEKEAKEFGASHFVATKDKSQMKRIAGSLDLIVSTVCADIDWLSYLSLLRPKGTLCIVGVPPGEIQIPAFALIEGQKTICGSVIGNRSMIQEMLEFSNEHGVKAKTEAVPLSEVNEACDKVRQNKARYRMVIEIGNT